MPDGGRASRTGKPARPRHLADSVVRTQTVELCAERRLHWVLGNEEPRCVDTDHDHRLVERHKHIDRVVLPNRTARRCAIWSWVRSVGSAGGGADLGVIADDLVDGERLRPGGCGGAAGCDGRADD